MKKFISTVLLLINLFAVVALLLSYCATIIPPDKLWQPSFFGLSYPFIFIANLLFVIFWIISKPKYSLLSLFAILVGLGYLSRYIQLAGKNSDEKNIKVVSYNVRHFEGYDEGNPTENSDKIMKFLNEQEADIICLQETRLRRNSIFNLQNTVNKLKTIEHYQYARSSNTFGLVTMTSYPIVNMSEIRFEGTGNMAIRTDVLIGKDTVSIFNVHLQSYGIDPDRYSIVESPGLNEKKDLHEVYDMAKKLKKAFQIRAVQAREINKQIDESVYPVIICGDFNDTPMSYTYQQLRENMTDAFINSGKGIGRTYVGKLPSFRIDNIFHSDEFESYNFKTYNFKMSDHLPISCNLELKN